MEAQKALLRERREQEARESAQRTAPAALKAPSAQEAEERVLAYWQRVTPSKHWNEVAAGFGRATAWIFAAYDARGETFHQFFARFQDILGEVLSNELDMNDNVLLDTVGSKPLDAFAKDPRSVVLKDIQSDDFREIFREGLRRFVELRDFLIEKGWKPPREPERQAQSKTPDRGWEPSGPGF